MIQSLLDLQKQLPLALQAIVVVLGGLSLLATPVHAALAIVATRYPKLEGASEWAASAGLHLQKWSTALAGVAKSLGSRGAGAAVILAALAAAQVGCTKQQVVKGESVVNDVLTDAQKACVIGEVVAPELGLNAATIADMRIICEDVGLANVAIVDIENYINALTPSQKSVAASMLKRQAQTMGAWPLAPLGKKK